MSHSTDNVAACRYTVPDYWTIGEVYERLIETMSLQSERGETMYDYEDTGRYPGWYSSCRSSSGSLYVHYGQHTVPLEVGDTYVTFVYDRFGERIETRIELPEGGTQP